MEITPTEFEMITEQMESADDDQMRQATKKLDVCIESEAELRAVILHLTGCTLLKQPSSDELLACYPFSKRTSNAYLAM